MSECAANRRFQSLVCRHSLSSRGDGKRPTHPIPRKMDKPGERRKHASCRGKQRDVSQVEASIPRRRAEVRHIEQLKNQPQTHRTPHNSLCDFRPVRVSSISHSSVSQSPMKFSARHYGADSATGKNEDRARESSCNLQTTCYVSPSPPVGPAPFRHWNCKQIQAVVLSDAPTPHQLAFNFTPNPALTFR